MKQSTLTDLLLKKHETLMDKGQISTAKLYKDTAGSIERFCAAGSIKPILTKINQPFLESYEKWMLCQGRSFRHGDKSKPASDSTVGMYLRNVRHIIRQAFTDGLIKNYPFGVGRYVIPSSSKSRQARSIDDIQKIINYTCANQRRIFYRDMWLFSYLCNGMNMGDIAELRVENINTDTMTFEYIRRKSARSKKGSLESIQGVLFDKSVEIIEKWGNQSGLLFNIYSDSMTQEDKAKEKNKFIKQVNEHMSIIGQDLGLTGDLRTYVARHTFANVLMQSEAPIALISKALGHSKITTTSAYLGRFTTDKQRSYMSSLLSNNQ